jgi:hypothetical protein
MLAEDIGPVKMVRFAPHILRKLRRAEGGAKMFGVFRVKNHDFTPKNHISAPVIILPLYDNYF